ncbi:NaeI family type II restriction endonuclease [Actinocorallia herbida]|uniref:NaeI family type II restriction endonuclease n=1 Tax=Actinocorallia herbida TaxID=58109 RepID=UPI001477832C|nr:NaeI family type II restriction endonuclease [Actinocorallia herbida]
MTTDLLPRTQSWPWSPARSNARTPLACASPKPSVTPSTWHSTAERTGRHHWDQLHKTEKDHFGGLAEIAVQRELGFPDGHTTEIAICDLDIGCKYARKEAEWDIPSEVHEEGLLFLGLWANDGQLLWSVGLVRPNEETLTPGAHNHHRLTTAGKLQINWLYRYAPLPDTSHSAST